MYNSSTRGSFGKKKLPPAPIGKKGLPGSKKAPPVPNQPAARNSLDQNADRNISACVVHSATSCKKARGETKHPPNLFYLPQSKDSTTLWKPASPMVGVHTSSKRGPERQIVSPAEKGAYLAERKGLFAQENPGYAAMKAVELWARGRWPGEPAHQLESMSGGARKGRGRFQVRSSVARKKLVARTVGRDFWPSWCRKSTVARW